MTRVALMKILAADAPTPTQYGRQAAGEVARATGRRYQNLEQVVMNMDNEAALDLIRLIRDLQGDARSERNKRQRGQFF